ncbi:hypothetical protein SPRG_14737 [Saprolegnia parasitica CBS 223.65]|uniref:Uncharacterized protein n=1 Tax=Saprolegnia parasitica (strain CBS 223.65) TaxID=695850 RepID=A0A067BN23_SAPPC|nr:hypothetical protein SPRG_14737 [Saprolegnia parasitica CBS 223.65]KDO19894.1 hypothetical protein SPRG_14737 [Saprolegnia parasitica CBS 223.65]|eukprot:XP_012209396.1 hypothetical protein SPRG_14737 [Saprolegnia parasitica CBS 223.65]
MFDNGGGFDLVLATIVLFLAMPMVFYGAGIPMYSALVSCFFYAFTFAWMFGRAVSSDITVGGAVAFTVFASVALVLPCLAPSSRGFLIVGFPAFALTAAFSSAASPFLVLLAATAVSGALGGWGGRHERAQLFSTALSGALMITLAISVYVIGKDTGSSSYSTTYRYTTSDGYTYTTTTNSKNGGSSLSPNLVVGLFFSTFLVGLLIQAQCTKPSPAAAANNNNDAPYQAA